MIVIICVGRLKERFFTEGTEYYRSQYANSSAIGGARSGSIKNGPLRIVEVPDESAPERLSEAQKRQIKEKEGKAILKRIGAAATVVALDMNGEKYSKAEIRSLLRRHSGDIAFVIGGSLGLGQNVLERADYRWSLSAMTLPHQLARMAAVRVIASEMERIMTNGPACDGKAAEIR